jgi:hypothetical protein
MVMPGVGCEELKAAQTRRLAAYGRMSVSSLQRCLVYTVLPIMLKVRGKILWDFNEAACPSKIITSSN